MIDFTTLIRDGMEREEKVYDGLLHPSTHLDGSLRHAWLDLHGYPRLPKRFANQTRLDTGTYWHKRIMGWLQGAPAMFEVTLTPWLPEGWAGTFDILLYDAHQMDWHLKDLKTIEDIKKVETWGIKGTNAIQTQAYAGAIAKMGLRLNPVAEVVYIPIAGDGEPTTFEVPVTPEAQEMARLTMLDVQQRVLAYTDLPPIPADLVHYRRTLEGVTVHGQSHMSRGFCPFHAEICGCKVESLKWTKLGTFRKVWGVIGFYGMDGEPGLAPEGVDMTRVEEMLQ